VADDRIGSLVKQVRRAGAREYEVFLQESRVTEIHTRLKEVELVATARTAGYALRVHDGGLGLASASLFASSPERTARLAISSARQSEKVKFEFPTQKKENKVLAEDRELVDSPVKEVEEYKDALLQSSESNGVVLTFSKSRAFVLDSFLVNSSGLRKRKRETYFQTEACLKVGTASPTEFWILRYARSPDGLRSKLQEWMEVAKSSVGATTPASGKMDIILPPSVSADLLVDVLGFHASGESVKMGLSKLRKGQVVAPEFMDVLDDGLYPMGLRTAPVDDEGNPQGRTVLIKGGVFKGRIYDQFWAAKFGVSSTGNGVREPFGTVNTRFLASPRCLPTNIAVSEGDLTLEEIIGETKKGLIVYNFAWLIPDRSSGSFSSEIRNASMVENGRVSHSVRGGVVSGNVFDLMKGVAAITREREVVSGGTAFSGVMPTIKFSGVEVAGE
jgi:PmbA protein